MSIISGWSDIWFLVLFCTRVEITFRALSCDWIPKAQWFVRSDDFFAAVQITIAYPQPPNHMSLRWRIPEPLREMWQIGQEDVLTLLQRRTNEEIAMCVHVWLKVNLSIPQTFILLRGKPKCACGKNMNYRTLPSLSLQVLCSLVSDSWLKVPLITFQARC